MGATGRLPNVLNLGLNEVGVKTGSRGEIIVNSIAKLILNRYLQLVM